MVNTLKKKKQQKSHATQEEIEHTCRYYQYAGEVGFYNDKELDPSYIHCYYSYLFLLVDNKFVHILFPFSFLPTFVDSY